MRIAGLAVTLLLAACGSPAPEPTPEPPPSPTGPAVGRRDCDDSVRIMPTNEWRAHAPRAGPVAFAPLDYRFGDRAQFARRDRDADGWRLFKVVLSLETGARATLTIPAALRDVASLTYLDGRDSTVAFASCEAAVGALPDTQFAGGFALREALCLPVEVTSASGTDRVVLDFGRGGC